MHESDLLVAPSLGGESFGMVLTEAFASGTPVVASDIAGYRDVVNDGVDGVLVPAGDPVALGEALHALALDPERRARMGAAACKQRRALRWSHVADEVMEAYEDAIAIAARTAPESTRERIALRAGLKPADGLPVIPPQKLESIEPVARPENAADLGRSPASRAMPPCSAAPSAARLTYIALQRIGTDETFHSLVAATPVWVLVALALMGMSMLLRAEAWTAILRAAIPEAPVRRRDARAG